MVYDAQGPLWFIQKPNGPERGLAHIEFIFDQPAHDSVGSTSCQNGGPALCPALGMTYSLFCALLYPMKLTDIAT